MPPSKLIVKNLFPPQRFLLLGGFIIKGGILYVYVYVYIYIYIYICIYYRRPGARQPVVTSRGKFPPGLGIAALKTKDLFESNPLKFQILCLSG